MTSDTWAIGIDVGGTFVDAVACSLGGRVVSLKHPRGAPTAGDLRGHAAIADAVLEAVDRLLASWHIDPADVLRVVHGSTIVTNLLLELDAPPVAVLATRGTRDVLALGRQNRRELYEPVVAPATPREQLFPDALRFDIGGRIDAQGQEVEPLDEAAVEAAADVLLAAGVRSVAVGLLFSYLDARHERRVRELLLARDPSLFVSLSSEVDPRPREFERMLATALDAYAKPRTAAYLAALAQSLGMRGLPEPMMMRSEGGIAPWREVACKPLSLALSGPCAALEGVAASLRGPGGVPPVAIAMDVGGTSTDIGLLDTGQPLFSDSLQIGQLDVRLRCADIESVAVGGGSIASVLPGGALRLGPRSQGAVPGPAAYGRGGSRATLTDALCVLGRLPAALAGGLRMDRHAARDALQREVAAPLGVPVEAAAQAVVRTAASAMAEALRMRTFQRGLDPADCLLVAAGGGGAQHAAEVAELADIARVRVLPHAGVIAALGLLCAKPERTIERACRVALDAAGVAQLASQRFALLPDWSYASVRWSLALCHPGQDFTLEIDWHPGTDTVDALHGRFLARHEQLRGQTDAGQAVEVRALRAVCSQTLPPPGLGETPLPPAPTVWQRADAAAGGHAAAPDSGAGPVALCSPATTVWVPAGWQWQRLADHSLLLTRLPAGRSGGAGGAGAAAAPQGRSLSHV